jgi:predicted Zn finger-like uncharacterized protein
MAGRPSSFEFFTCPNCKALYHIVKVEAGPETVFQEVPCRVCGEQFVGREGNCVLKYFLLREAARVQKWPGRIEKPQPAMELAKAKKSTMLRGPRFDLFQNRTYLSSRALKLVVILQVHPELRLDAKILG